MVEFVEIFENANDKEAFFDLYEDISLDEILLKVFDLFCSIGFIFIAYAIGKRASESKRKIEKK
jgi:hypothetical protein